MDSTDINGHLDSMLKIYSIHMDAVTGPNKNMLLNFSFFLPICPRLMQSPFQLEKKLFHNYLEKMQLHIIYFNKTYDYEN